MIRYLWMKLSGYHQIKNPAIKRGTSTLFIGGLAWVKQRRGRTWVVLEDEHGKD